MHHVVGPCAIAVGIHGEDDAAAKGVIFGQAGLPIPPFKVVPQRLPLASKTGGASGSKPSGQPLPLQKKL